MAITKLKRLKLHWWIFLGIAIGVAWGFGLHRAYYADFLHTAHMEILGVDWTQEQALAQGKAIQAHVEAQFRHTFWGGTAYGLANLFLSLLRMIVIPLVMASLICGVARMRNFKTLKNIGTKAAGWYLTTSFLAVITGLFVVNLVRPGEGVTLSIPINTLDIPVPDTVWDMLLAVVPHNIIHSAAHFELLPLIFFSILFGIFMLTVDENTRRPVEDFVESIFEIMMKMTLFIISLAPVGIAALIAGLVATTGLEVFQSLAGYALSVALALGIHFVITLPLLFWLFTRRNPFKVMSAMSPALLTAFSTASSAGTLPLTIERTEHAVGVSNRVGGFVLPLGATVNMDGTALYECVATLFIAQLYAFANPDFVLTIEMQLIIVMLALLVSIGAAGIPHAGLVMMVIIFEAIGLPLEFMALLWAVDRPLDMCRTMVNVWSDTIGTVTIAHSEDELDEFVLFRKTQATSL